MYPNAICIEAFEDSISLLRSHQIKVCTAKNDMYITRVCGWLSFNGEFNVGTGCQGNFEVFYSERPRRRTIMIRKFSVHVDGAVK